MTSPRHWRRRAHAPSTVARRLFLDRQAAVLGAAARRSLVGRPSPARASSRSSTRRATSRRSCCDRTAAGAGTAPASTRRSRSRSTACACAAATRCRPRRASRWCRITVKRVAGRPRLRVACTTTLRAGRRRSRLGPAAGRLRPARPGRRPELLFVSGGSGITPVDVDPARSRRPRRRRRRGVRALRAQPQGRDLRAASSSELAARHPRLAAGLRSRRRRAGRAASTRRGSPPRCRTSPSARRTCAVRPG